ncbi:MAG: hypothetical protein ACYCX3_13335 [Thermoleophilia bacterium]
MRARALLTPVAGPRRAVLPPASPPSSSAPTEGGHVHRHGGHDPPQHSEEGLTVDRGQAIAELKEFRRGRTLGVGLTVRDMIDEGRRS